MLLISPAMEFCRPFEWVNCLMFSADDSYQTALVGICLCTRTFWLCGGHLDGTGVRGQLDFPFASAIFRALIEIVVGVIAGNIHFAGGQHILQTTDWTNFLAMLGSWRADVPGRRGKLIRFRCAPICAPAWRLACCRFCFHLPACGCSRQFVLGWPLHQAQIAGIALSTTSVAVVYAGDDRRRFWPDPARQKRFWRRASSRIWAPCWRSARFSPTSTVWLLVFVVVTAVMLWLMPKLDAAHHQPNLGATRVSEPEVKIHFLRAVFPGRAGVHGQK